MYLSRVLHDFIIKLIEILIKYMESILLSEVGNNFSESYLLKGYLR